jgi:Bacterial virulence factor lipase N-terminal
MSTVLALRRGSLVSAMIALGAVAFGAKASDDAVRSQRVFARFDLERPRTGPFPSDIFTVKDVKNITGRRLNYPLPNCDARPSDCDDLEIVNTFDGWGLEQQVSIPFTGDVDPESVSSDSVFLINLSSELSGHSPTGALIGINQIVWDPETHTAYAEVDKQLDQHRRYALIVTDAVRDSHGRRVKATQRFKTLDGVPGWYANRLEKAFEVAADLGIAKRHEIVSASVFSTQSVTPVMERLRDRIKKGVPAPADFRVGPGKRRSVFRAGNVAAVVWKQHVAAGPDRFEFADINLAPLDVVPGSVGTIAYGRYVSPQYLVLPDVYIPPVGTRTGIPRVQNRSELPFTLYLPSGPQPEDGWPIALIGPGATQGQNGTTTNFAATLAAHGIATIGINTVGQGYGPRSNLIVELPNGKSVTVPNPGRGLDQDGDGFIFEGYEAAPPRDWTIRFSHAHLQTVIDYMQLVRVIEVGMDVNGDADPDIDPSRIYFVGASTGSMIGTIFLALEPSVRVGALVVAPGMLPEHARWMPVNRPLLGAFLEARTPSLINRSGLTEIDGVPVDGPYYNENKPLRDQPPVINDVPGAIRIQQAFEFSELASGVGTSPALWSRYLRDTPLPGVDPKSVIYLFAKGDQISVNPGTSALLRPGNLADRTLYYRHDLAFEQDPSIPPNPHTFAGLVLFPNPLVSSIARGAQEMIAVLFASDGDSVIHPEPAQFFEVPIVGPLPETLNFIP